MQKHWVWLATRSGIGVRGRAELLRRFGTAERIYAMDRAALQAEEGLRRSWLEPLLDKTLDGAERILAQCDRFDIRLLTYAEPAYPERLRNIAHFASREAMDIDGLGISLCQSLIEAGLVHSPAELYALEPQSVAALDHMGKKSAENLMAAIEKSKDAGMARLLCAFGIRQVGQKAARVLAMHFGTLDKLMAATEEELMAIPDVGPTTAAYLRAWFDNPQSQHQIRLLRDAGVSFDSREQVVDRRFAGKTFVLTGALEHFSRDEASAIIERFGGKTSSSVSKKTSYLLAGENTGSKYQKALTLGTPIITEAEFLDMIQE